MDWTIWFKKLGFRVALAACVVTVAEVTGLAESANLSALELLIAQVALIALEQAQNWLKHQNEPVME